MTAVCMGSWISAASQGGWIAVAIAATNGLNWQVPTGVGTHKGESVCTMTRACWLPILAKLRMCSIE